MAVKTEPIVALGELLELFVDGAPFIWSSTTQFGSAGTVTLEFDLNPAELPEYMRFELLSIAARLANWHHREVEQ